MNILTTEQEWLDARAAPRAVVYKHSTACPTSARALREIERFEQDNPAVPVYVVDVLRERELAVHIAHELGILHQSPQAIILSYGESEWHGSHWGVRANAIEQAICVSEHRGDPTAIEEACGEPEPAGVPFITVPRFLFYLVGLAGLVGIALAPGGGRAVLVIGAIAGIIYLSGLRRRQAS